MQLTEHFSVEEMTATQTRIDNTPPQEVMSSLRIVAESMEIVRGALGDRPIHVNSGYRSPEVNTAVGGSKTSAHMQGFACDFICPKFGTPIEVCEAIVAAGIRFDQLIEEGTWVHISFARPMRQEVLTKRGPGYTPGLSER